MREILNRYTLGGLTAVYRREGDIVELLLVPAGSALPVPTAPPSHSFKPS